MTRTSNIHHSKVISKAERRKQLIGLEGWLALFIVGLFLGLIITVFNFFIGGFLSSADISDFNEYQTGFGDTFQVFILIESIALIVFIGMMITTLTLLIRRRKLARSFAIATLAYGAIYSVLDYSAALALFSSAGLMQDVYVSAVFDEASKNAGRNVLGAAVWIPYFLVSKRVARTLQNPSSVANADHSQGLTQAIWALRSDTAVRYIGIASAILMSVVVIVLLAGGSIFDTWEKTDGEYKPETFRTEYTGRSDISQSGDQICSGGEDYSWCVNQHVVVYNSSCANQSLTTPASDTCGELLDFINQTKSRLQTCGYNCTTIADSSGRWGWPYLQLTPESRQLSNGDQQEATTHTAVCIISVGIIKIGECK